MLLQAFVDDSATEKGDKRLFMAGYLNRAENWTLFSRAWDEELKEPPAIAYFRMVEANNLRGEFRGWTPQARDQKLRSLARVINHFKPLSFQFTINRGEFERVLRPVSPRGLGSPHFVCCFSVISGVSRYVAGEGGKLPIEFIFDEQNGVDADMPLIFHEMKRRIPRQARKLIKGTPAFRNDKIALPLQAADMLAWHLRREYEDRKSDDEILPMADLLRNPKRHLVSHVDDSWLEKWADHYSQQPGVHLLKSKGQWQKFRKNLVSLADSGLIPPHGNRLRHFLFRLRLRVISIIARRSLIRGRQSER